MLFYPKMAPKNKFMPVSNPVNIPVKLNHKIKQEQEKITVKTIKNQQKRTNNSKNKN